MLKEHNEKTAITIIPQLYNFLTSGLIFLTLPYILFLIIPNKYKKLPSYKNLFIILVGYLITACLSTIGYYYVLQKMDIDIFSSLINLAIVISLTIDVLFNIAKFTYNNTLGSLIIILANIMNITKEL